MQEAACEVKTEVDEMVGKVIDTRKSYKIAFQIGVIISQGEIN